MIVALAIGSAVSSRWARTDGCTPRPATRSTSPGFTGAAAKAALASVAMALAIVQIVTAMGLYGRIRCEAPGLAACIAGRDDCGPDLGACRCALPVCPGLGL